MAELYFESSLSMEEIEENFRDVNFFDGIMEGLKEAIAVSNGNPSAETVIRTYSVPTPTQYKVG